MKVSISYTVEATDSLRRAINNYYGRDGLASRDDVKSWFEMFGNSATDDIMYDLEDG